MRTAILNPIYAPALVVVGVLIAAGGFAEHQNNTLHQQSLRADVLTQLSVVRAKLEGNIGANLQLVRGLVASISTNPQMDEQEFEALASRLFGPETSQLRSIAVAPDLVVTMTYPLAGNERVIGLDYRRNAAQRDAALRVIETGEMVLAGPVELVQGGRGFVGRYPVYVGQPSDRRFWGVVSAVIDAERLYAAAGLYDSMLPIHVAIAGKDALGSTGAQFYGHASTFRNDPVTAEVLLPTGSWVVAAVPRAGWGVQAPGTWLIRGLTALLGALLVFPIIVGGRLLEERRRNLQALGSREAELRRLSRRLGLALETSRLGAWEYDVETGALIWDDRMREIYGVAGLDEAITYDHWRERLHPDDAERAREDFRIAVAGGGLYSSDYRIVTPKGDVRHVRALGRVYEDSATAAKVVGVNWDATLDVKLNSELMRAKRMTEARNAELEAAKARIEHNSLHDSLTGLPNRRYLDDMLRHQAERCVRERRALALLHVDLDRFKQINDTLGHAAGDAMLIHASKVLESNIRDDDFVARIGGDEFVVVCAAPDSARLAQLAERIIETMRQPVAYDGHECRFGVSVGIAVEDGPDINPKRLLIDADIALYKAKRRGRNRLEFFTEALQAEVVKTKRVADEILSGLENGEFVAYYQPQVDARTLDIVGVEALSRWRHPTEGILPPSEFLAVAEELNVVSTIDRTILDQALKDLRRWRAAGLNVPRVSVNVSARRLQDENLIASLRELDIERGAVSFELVESIFLDETDDIVMFNIDQIKELGIDVEIDDFGTGYASIVSLLKLKPRRLKIDRQLVKPIVESVAQRQLVQSIIDIGRSLGIQVVGEGVESTAHAEILRDLGCDSLQGYAFARPMAASDLGKFVRNEPWRAASLDPPATVRHGKSVAQG